jgi:D-arabinose 1-dehydrogenase-like Zn-dependent alcohol dehydrogenase
MRMGMKSMGGSWLKILGVAIGVAVAAAVIVLAVRRGKLSVDTAAALENVQEEEQEKVQEEVQEEGHENQTKAAMALEKETPLLEKSVLLVGLVGSLAAVAMGLAVGLSWIVAESRRRRMQKKEEHEEFFEDFYDESGSELIDIDRLFDQK